MHALEGLSQAPKLPSGRIARRPIDAPMGSRAGINSTITAMAFLPATAVLPRKCWIQDSQGKNSPPLPSLCSALRPAPPAIVLPRPRARRIRRRDYSPACKWPESGPRARLIKGCLIVAVVTASRQGRNPKPLFGVQDVCGGPRQTRRSGLAVAGIGCCCWRGALGGGVGLGSLVQSYHGYQDSLVKGRALSQERLAVVNTLIYPRVALVFLFVYSRARGGAVWWQPNESQD